MKQRRASEITASAVHHRRDEELRRSLLYFEFVFRSFYFVYNTIYLGRIF